MFKESLNKINKQASFILIYHHKTHTKLKQALCLKTPEVFGNAICTFTTKLLREL